jgi:hypothetical protein
MTISSLASARAMSVDRCACALATVAMGDVLSGRKRYARDTRSTTAPLCWSRLMTTVEDIKKAVANLPPEDLAAFRAWFEAFDAARIDGAIERDAADGNLDRLAEAALAAGRSREL